MRRAFWEDRWQWFGAALAGVVLLTAGCRPTSRSEAPAPAPVAAPPAAGVSFRFLGKTPQRGDVYIMTIQETGCEYLYVEMFQNGVTITPHQTRVPYEAVRTAQAGCRG